MRRATLSMFAQIVQLLPQSLFFKLVQKYQTDKGSKGISTRDQLIAMMFCQLGGAESLREIADGLYSSLGKLNHLSDVQAFPMSTNTVIITFTRTSTTVCWSTSEAS